MLKGVRLRARPKPSPLHSGSENPGEDPLTRANQKPGLENATNPSDTCHQDCQMHHCTLQWHHNHPWRICRPEEDIHTQGYDKEPKDDGIEQTLHFRLPAEVEVFFRIK